MSKTAPLSIGVATADITPPVGVTLVGYAPRVSTGLGHGLRAEALVVRDAGGAGWAMVASDVIGYPRAMVQRVRRKIATRTTLRGQAVLICGTHTHSGPATMDPRDQEMSETDAKYNEALEGKLADLVVAAEAAAEGGQFQVAWCDARELASNRRVVGPDGNWTNEWRDPDGRHAGYVDPSVMLVAVQRQDGSRDALLVNYGCHPVVLGRKSLNISADYVGYMKDALEAGGTARTAMFAIAGGADINPRLCIRTDAQDPRAMGRRLAEIVARAARDMTPVAGGAVLGHQEPWNIVRTRPATGAGDVMETEIQVLRAGELCVIGLPGELFSEYSAMLRQASPCPQTIIASLANDYVGYLPTNEALAQGAYEAEHAPADGIEDALMATAQKAFAAVSA